MTDLDNLRISCWKNMLIKKQQTLKFRGQKNIKGDYAPPPPSLNLNKTLASPENPPLGVQANFQNKIALTVKNYFLMYKESPPTTQIINTFWSTRKSRTIVTFQLQVKTTAKKCPTCIQQKMPILSM